jgi:hypothetical protein
VIIFDDFDEEEEVHEYTATNADVAPSATAAVEKPSTPSASPTDADEEQRRRR